MGTLALLQSSTLGPNVTFGNDGTGRLATIGRMEGASGDAIDSIQLPCAGCHAHGFAWACVVDSGS